MITSPPPVTAKTWLSLGTDNTTLLRSMENSLLSQLELAGRSLDVGGGKDFGYVDQIKVVGQLESVNFDAALQPTYVADLNDALSMPNGSYDNVICFNTLEHIYDETKLLKEILRVLKPGGRFVITVPFLFRRHGKYGDFHRHTADYWEQLLVDQGIDSTAFAIRPLVWCPLSSALSSLTWFRGGVRGRLTKLFVMTFELARGVLFRQHEARQGYKDWALAFYIDGTKRPSAALERRS